MFIHGFLLCNVLGIECWVLNTLNLDNVFVCCTLGHRLVKYLQDIIVLSAACLEVNHMHLRFSISCLVHWHWIPCVWFFSCKNTISDDMYVIMYLLHLCDILCSLVPRLHLRGEGLADSSGFIKKFVVFCMHSCELVTIVQQEIFDGAKFQGNAFRRKFIFAKHAILGPHLYQLMATPHMQTWHLEDMMNQRSKLVQQQHSLKRILVIKEVLFLP